MKFNLINKIYLLIVIIALTVDLIIFKGNSGLLVMATLPVAVIAMFCFIVGQFSKIIDRKIFFFNWINGCVLVLLGFICFPTKDSELVFTYAMLITSPPASLLLGLNPNIATGFSTSALISRALLRYILLIQMLLSQWKVRKMLILKSLKSIRQRCKIS